MGKKNEKLSEDAAFIRCIDFMVKMIEKYGAEENNTYNKDLEEDKVI